MLDSLSNRNHILQDRFMLLIRSLQVGARGCVQVAVDRLCDHERVVVKTFFRMVDFEAEEYFYSHTGVLTQRIVRKQCTSVKQAQVSTTCAGNQASYMKH